MCTFVYSFSPFPPNIFKLHSESKSVNVLRLLKVVKLFSKKAVTIYPPAGWKCWVTVPSCTSIIDQYQRYMIYATFTDKVYCYRFDCTSANYMLNIVMLLSFKHLILSKQQEVISSRRECFSLSVHSNEQSEYSQVGCLKQLLGFSLEGPSVVRLGPE